MKDKGASLATLLLVTGLAAGGGSFLLEHPAFLHLMGVVGGGILVAGAAGEMLEEADAEERKRLRVPRPPMPAPAMTAAVTGNTTAPKAMPAPAPNRSTSAMYVDELDGEQFEITWLADEDGRGEALGGACDVLGLKRWFGKDYLVLLEDEDAFDGELPRAGSTWMVEVAEDGLDDEKGVIWVEPRGKLTPSRDEEPWSRGEPSMMLKVGDSFEVRWVRDRKGPGVVAYHESLFVVPDRSYTGPVPAEGSWWKVSVVHVLEAKHTVFVRPFLETSPAPGAPVGPSDAVRKAAELLKREEENAAAAKVDRVTALEGKLRARIKGQEAAIGQIVATLRRRFAREERRGPVASFFLAGPTGVGKSETAKLIAKELDLKLMTLNMAEYHESHTVSRFIGSPPGYMGSDEGGQLTRPVRDNPRSLILFDEIDKAHLDVYKPLLSVMDEGTLTDASDGEPSDYRQCILIFTSNHALDELAAAAAAAGADESRLNDELRKVLRDAGRFAPEWVGRLNRVVYFRPLPRDAQLEIIEGLVREIASSVRVDLAPLSPEVLLHLWKLLGGAEFGVRGMSSTVEDRVVDLLLPHKGKGGKVELLVKDGNLLAQAAT